MKNSLKGLKFKSLDFPMNYFFDNVLELTFEINTEDTWDKNFNVSLNEEGKIIECSSLKSTMNNIEYYIEMGKILETVKAFCDTYGKNLYKEIKNEVMKKDEKIERLYKEEEEIISRIKEKRNYEGLVNKEKELFNQITDLTRKCRRLRREDRIESVK